VNKILCFFIPLPENDPLGVVCGNFVVVVGIESNRVMKLLMAFIWGDDLSTSNYALTVFIRVQVPIPHNHLLWKART